MNINLWSSPRNVSTALMYSFAQHPRVAVVDEPLYAHYLLRTDSPAVHPGREEIIASQRTDRKKLVDELLRDDAERVRVFKQMTHHLIQLDWSFLPQMKNVLLIRDPRRILASYTKVIENPTISDVGYDLQGKLFDYLVANDALHAIVDTRRLLTDPEDTLRQLCERLDLKFDPAMLQWSAGARPEDGVWAKHWYGNVHQSTEFAPYEEKIVGLSDELEALAERCMPDYERMLGSQFLV